MKAASAKAKGRRLEQQVVDELTAIGFECRRQPGSGIYQGFDHDVVLERGRPFIIECKSRKEGWKTLERWRGKADVLVLKVDRGQPFVYMPLSVLGELMA